MVTVDGKGRIVLPQHVRERLGIAPGTEVDVRADDGRAVVEPEEDPERIIEDLSRLVERASADREKPSGSQLDAASQRHLESIRRHAESAQPE